MHRTILEKARSEAWWVDVACHWSDREWKNNFRLSRATFVKLCSKLRPFISRRNSRFRRAVAVRKRVAVCLWRLAGNVEYRTISHLFGIGQSTAATITNNVCKAAQKIHSNSVR